MRYLVLAIAGLVAQLVVLLVFAADHGLDFAEMGDQIFGSTIAVLTFVDLAFCAVVYLVWMPREARRAGIEAWWPFAIATLGGVCFAFPLFLHARDRSRARMA
jgi:uncharacterized protein DUF2834